MSFRIDPDFYRQTTEKIAKDNRELAGAVAVKLLYHPITLACTFICMAAVGGTLEGGTPFFIALLIAYLSSYISTIGITFLVYTMSGNFKTAPPEQYIEIIWLMSKGYRLMHDEVDLRIKTKEVERQLQHSETYRDGLMQELQNMGYTTLEVECLRRGFIPVTITDRCGMGFASAYRRHRDEIWRWQA